MRLQKTVYSCSLYLGDLKIYIFSFPAEHEASIARDA